MAIEPFLAMTAAEIRNLSAFPGKIAWMACHFSPYGTGLSNLPHALPPDSLLIVNDRTPIHGHDPQWIAQQLGECVARLGCCGVLLDFQRPEDKETAALVKVLAKALPCPVAVSDLYAGNVVDCPVFPPPVPPSMPLKEYLAPWAGREIWLELALDGEEILLAERGATVAPLPFVDSEAPGFIDDQLHCHYHIQLEDDAARFTLWRTRKDLAALLEEAESCGITTAVGLYQEWNHIAPVKSSLCGKA